jgi:hypothetical protein
MVTMMKPKRDKSYVSQILRVIGLVAWIIPIIGAPISIIGLIFGIKSYSGKNRSYAVAGIVLCIIGLLATIINGSIGAYKGATGQLWDSTPALEEVVFYTKIDKEPNPIDDRGTFLTGHQFYAVLHTKSSFKTTQINVTIFKTRREFGKLF